ncbi:MAG TPA: alpha/beta hydrolase [Methylomirabilota bacterium]|nr:alpha/beta hydrolase [Methylomirabilota bacterium]
MGEPIFRGYDREALDREYDNQRKVADSADWLARYPRESEATRRAFRCRLDLRYGSSAAETLDVFPATGPGPAPVQVFIHGGYWRALDKADFSFVARAFVPAGAATAVVNYGLIPAIDMDELVRQCRAAVAWLHRNAASFGGDPARIFVSGHSAGGHLVAMLLATDWPRFAGLPRDVIKGGAGISGLYDLEPIRLCYLNETLELTPETARRNSPVHLRSGSRVPLLLPLGADEGPEYHRQTEDLAAAWARHGVPAEVMDLADHNHFSIVSLLEDPTSALSGAILRQMGLGR